MAEGRLSRDPDAGAFRKWEVRDAYGDEIAVEAVPFTNRVYVWTGQPDYALDLKDVDALIEALQAAKDYLRPDVSSREAQEGLRALAKAIAEGAL